MPVSFTLARSTALITDNDNDGYADASDVLRHFLTIHNTGTSDALNVVLNDLLGGSTETGLMNISPIAFNDVFNAVGNTLLEVGNATAQTGPQTSFAGNLLTNDFGSTTVGAGALAGDDVTGFTISALQATAVVGVGPVIAASVHGSVTLITSGADAGSFTYISNAGFTGDDTFTYTIKDAGIDGIAGNADDTTSTASVTIHVGGQVWYVDSGYAGGSNDGTSAHPFTSITALNTANVDGANDTIYVRGNATGQLVMETGEHLIGQGASLDVTVSAVNYHIADAGSRSTITNSAAGFAVTLAGGGTGNNEIAGINILSTGGTGNHALTGTSFGTLTISNTTVDASGQGVILSTGAITGTGLVSTDSDGGTNNVALTGITGSLTLGSGALSGATGSSFLVSGGTVSTSYSGNITQANNAALLDVLGGHGTGTLTFNTGTLSATNGTGLQFNNADGTYNLNCTSTMNGGDAGIDIVNGSSGNFSFHATSSITNPSGIGFNVNGGTGNIDYNGTISHNTNANAISVQNHTGGTVSFDGTVSSTGSSDGILLATNTGAIINFTNTLTINTSASNTTGFSATGGGTISATHSGSTINSGSGTAFNASGGTTIGAGGVTFQSISSNGSVNGIVLNNTGSTGFFTVTGDGSQTAGLYDRDGSGGTIQLTTHDAISLTNAFNVTIRQMNVTNAGWDGVGSVGGGGITLSAVDINHPGNANPAPDGSTGNTSGFGGGNGWYAQNLTGVNNFDNNSRVFNWQSSQSNAVLLYNTDTNFTSFTVDNAFITTSATGAAGFHANLNGATTGAINLTDTDLTLIDQNGAQVLNNGTGTITATIQRNNFHDADATSGDGNNTLYLAQSGGGLLNFRIGGTNPADGNTFHNLARLTTLAGVVQVDLAGGSAGTGPGSINGFIQNNNIWNDAGFVNGRRAIDIQVEADNHNLGSAKVDISNNTVNNVQGNAIHVSVVSVGGGSVTDANWTITGNSLGAAGTNNGIRVGLDNTDSASAIEFETNVDVIASSNAVLVNNLQVSNNTGVNQANNATGATLDITNIGSSGASGSATLNATITNNNFTNQDTSGTGHVLDVLNSSASSHETLNLNITGNNTTRGASSLGEIRLRELAGTFNVQGGVAGVSGNNSGDTVTTSGSFGTVGSVTPPTAPTNFLFVAPPPPAPPADNGSKGTGDGTGGEFVPPPPTADPGAPDPVTPPPSPPPVVDDGILSQAELNLIVGAAIDRWAAAGATTDEITAMKAVVFSVEDLQGLVLGSSNAGHVTLDSNAAGFSWFIDLTPNEDSEFSGQGTDLYADKSTTAGVRIDLLTTVMHELGHQIGLDDSYLAADRADLMYGTIDPGERRLPDAHDVALATGTPNDGTDFALSPVNLGTIPAGQTVTVQWDSTVNAFTNQIVPTFNNTSSVSGSNFVTATSNTEILGPASAPIALDSLTLGNLIFLDANNNGTFDGADTGINGVALTLFADTNANGVFDSGIDTQIATTTTAGGGLYSFANLAPGDYIVRVDAANFTGGGALVSKLTATGGSDPDNNTDNDDNGANGAGGIVVSQTITLTQNGEATADGTGHLDINNTLDFGFITLNQAPVNTVPGATQVLGEDATKVFSAGNGNAISVNDVDAGAGNLTVTLSVLHGAVTLSGTAGLAFGAGDGTADATMTFTGTQSAINTALQGLSYAPTANYNGPDTLTITTNDNGNTGSDPGLTGGPNDEQDSDTVAITVNSVNDAPSGADNTVTFAEDGTYVFSVADFGFTDPDNNNFDGVFFTTVPASGTIFYDADGPGGNAPVAMAANSFVIGPTAAADIAAGKLYYVPVPNANGSPYSSFHFQVHDDGGTANGGTNIDLTFNNFTFNVTAVNDAPVNTVPGTQTINEDATRTFSAGNGNAISVSDVDVGAGNLTVTLSVAHGVLTLSGTAGLAFGTGDGTADATMTFTGAAASINTALNGLIYAPTGNYNGSDTLTLTTNDNGNTGTDPGLTGDASSEQDSDSVTINITPINDQPNIPNSPTINAIEQVAMTINPAITVSDVDLDARNGGAGDYGGAAFAINRTASNPEDLFSFDTSGASFTVSGGNLEVGGVVIAALAQSGGILNINFVNNGTAPTTALVNDVLQHLQYTNTSDSPPSSVTLLYVIDDGAPGGGQGTVVAGNDIDGGQVVINLTDTPENAAPVVDLNGAGSGIDDTASYTEQDPPVVLASGVIVTDVDDINIESASVRITAGLIANFDYLTVNGGTNGTITGITFNYVAATGILTLTGSATLADYQAVLAQVGFESTSNDPGTSRTISWTVNDGTSNSTAALTTVTVIPVNDEPTLVATGQNPVYTENGAAVDLFSAVTASTVEAGQTLISLTLTVTNVTDGANEILSFDGSSVALTNGNSVTTATNGLTVNVAVSGSIATLSFSGASLAPAQVQTLVDAMTYRNASENPTDADRVVTITELVDSGSNGSPNDNTASLSVSSTVNVNPVNDAASITGATTGDVTEAGGTNNGTAGTPTATGDLDSTDVDNTADAWQAVTAGGITANGYGTYALDAAGVWTYTLDDSNAAVQALNGAATLTDTFSALTADGTAQLVTITIHAQDDAPTARNDAVTTDEATVLNGNVLSNNGSGADFDDDGPPLAVSAVNGSGANVGVQITLASGAHLTLNADGTFSYDPNNAFNATPTLASGAANTPAPDSFTYTLAGGGTATVSVTVNGIDSNDLLLGTAASDMLSAGIGNDYLDGLGAADNMFGGLGNDTYAVDNAADVVNELAGQGRDVVYSMVSYLLAASAEIEVLSAYDQSGATPLALVGNAFGQEIYGNAGANFIEGGGGVDYLIGFAGNDVYVVQGGDDVIVEAVGGGTDVVYARDDYVLSAGAEVETLSTFSQDATTAMSLAGNTFGQTIYGNAGANFLDGGGGTDTLIGLAGNDVYVVDSASDYVAESLGGGRDVVYAKVSYSLGVGQEVEILSAVSQSAATAIDLTGNNLANELYGNAGANTLNGGAGADYLMGYGGADTFAFTTALGGGNVDAIGDFTAGTDKIALDDAVFTAIGGLGALNANAFFAGTAAHDADDRIVYDQTTGNLYYDADGNGAGAAVLFANLQTHPVITASDFQVI
jgi:VCBS repeat-containing protein